MCLHQAITNPLVVYVPLVIKKVAKYLTWLLSAIAASKAYPIPQVIVDPTMKRPRLWILSLAQEQVHATTAETAYGGTVINCERAFAVFCAISFRTGGVKEMVRTEAESAQDGRKECR